MWTVLTEALFIRNCGSRCKHKIGKRNHWNAWTSGVEAWKLPFRRNEQFGWLSNTGVDDGVRRSVPLRPLRSKSPHLETKRNLKLTKSVVTVGRLFDWKMENLCCKRLGNENDSQNEQKHTHTSIGISQQRYLLIEMIKQCRLSANSFQPYFMNISDCLIWLDFCFLFVSALLLLNICWIQYWNTKSTKSWITPSKKKIDSNLLYLLSIMQA